MRIDRRIETASDVRELITDLIARLGHGFHPDSEAGDYVAADGGLVFTPAEAEAIDRMMARAFEVCDVEEVAADFFFPFTLPIWFRRRVENLAERCNLSPDAVLCLWNGFRKAETRESYPGFYAFEEWIIDRYGK